MSYSIVFETKIVKLSDGRIIHFARSGCNNDNAGRKRMIFRQRFTLLTSLYRKRKVTKKDSRPYKEVGYMELKIGNRYATAYDYGEHLLRMFKRAMSYEEFIRSFCFRIEHLTGIQLHKPEEKFMTVDEFNKVFYQLLYGGNGMAYTRLIEYPDIKDEENLIRLIETGECLSFEIKSCIFLLTNCK